MSDDQIGWYLKEAGRIPLLTAAEEIELGHAIQQWQEIKDESAPDPRICRRGKKAYDRMFTANLRLVVNIAKKYLCCTHHMELQDLIQEGNLGLSRAVEKFDPERGYKFSTYAYWWIRQGVRRAMSQQERVIRLPINAIDVQAKISKFVDEYVELHGKVPTLDLCSEFCGVRKHTMRAYLEHMKRPTSLDCEAITRMGESKGSATYLEMVASQDPDPSDQLEIDTGLDKMELYLGLLPIKEAQALRYRYGLFNEEPKTYAQIGKLMGVSRERIRQLEAKALKTLRLRMTRRADMDLAD